MNDSSPHLPQPLRDAFRGIFENLLDLHQAVQQNYPSPLTDVKDTLVALTNAERQRQYRERRKVDAPALRYVTKTRKDKRSRVQRWQEAVEVLRDLQAQYQEWLDNLPESLQDSTLAEKLQVVCDLDIDELDVDLPRGFGRD